VSENPFCLKSVGPGREAKVKKFLFSFTASEGKVMDFTVDKVKRLFIRFLSSFSSMTEAAEHVQTPNPSQVLKL